MATASKSISTKIDDEIQFPDEIWMKIISYIPMSKWADLENVNKTFQRNVYASWRQIRIIKFDEDFTIDRRSDACMMFVRLARKLILRAPNIRALSGFKIFTHNIESNLFGENMSDEKNNFIQLLSEFNHLEKIDFTNVFISPRQLAKFLETPTIRGRLKKLKLKNCLPKPGLFDTSDDNNGILSKAFGDIPDKPPLRLDEFDIGGQSESFAFYKTMDVTNLNVLKINEARSNESFDRLDRLLINRCSTNLRHLECSIFYSRYHKELLSAIVSCENLSILKINYRGLYWNGNDVDLMATSQWIGRLSQFEHLSEFSFLIPQLINDDIITTIGDYLSNLITLELYVDNCGSATLTNLISKMNRLKKLGFYCSPTTENQIITGDVIETMTETLINLEYLHLTNPPIYQNMQNDLNRLEKIKELSFENGKNHHLIVWMTVFGIKLKSLTVKGFDDDEFQGLFISLLKSTPNLRRLSLQNCGDWNERSAAISVRCPNLEEFDISSGCLNVTGIQTIIDGCLKLKRIIGCDDKKWYSMLHFGKNNAVALI